MWVTLVELDWKDISGRISQLSAQSNATFRLPLVAHESQSMAQSKSDSGWNLRMKGPCCCPTFNCPKVCTSMSQATRIFRSYKKLLRGALTLRSIPLWVSGSCFLLIGTHIVLISLVICSILQATINWHYEECKCLLCLALRLLRLMTTYLFTLLIHFNSQ